VAVLFDTDRSIGLDVIERSAQWMPASAHHPLLISVISRTSRLINFPTAQYDGA
jgi:hypothetical protein